MAGDRFASQNREIHHLVTRVQQGDERAFTAFAELIAEHLGAVVTVLMGNRDGVQEIVQDVLYTAWLHCHELDPNGNVMGYLYRVARNQCIDTLRRDRSGQRMLQTMQLTTNDDGTMTWNNAEDVLAQSDIDTILANALPQIPPGPRRAFLLHHEAGMAYEDIAVALGVTVPTVRTMMYRATQKLATLLSKDLFR